mmetsp:Transcript_10091/g.29336  ORF Transcript_10091/g.29336 Transcript_10091/m.29336 type:complete len:226 (+) Transcript_10091:647-1324(+)
MEHEAAKPRESMAESPTKCSGASLLLMHMRLSKGPRAPKTQQLPQWPWLWIRPMTSAHSGHSSLASQATGKANPEDGATSLEFAGILPSFINFLIWPFVIGMRPKRCRNNSLDSGNIQSSSLAVKPKFNAFTDFTTASVTTGFWLSNAACAIFKYFKLHPLVPSSSLATADTSSTNLDLKAASSASVSSSFKLDSSTTWSNNAPAASSGEWPSLGLAPLGRCAVT